MYICVSQIDFFFMLQVGRYEDSQIDSLVPHIDELDPDVAKVFQMVFRKDPKVRPSALELLNVPKISEAHEYEKYFETCRCTCCKVSSTFVHSLYTI